MDEKYYPGDGTYVPFPGVFATWIGASGDVPNPCLKYHVSSDLSCAGQVAAVVLPILRELLLHHKIVQSSSRLARLQAGTQAGKFITVYCPPHIPKDALVERISHALTAVRGLKPSPTIPKSRHYHHVFAEQPLDRAMFVYGGFLTDPGE
jgi:hypothetical protein